MTEKDLIKQLKELKTVKPRKDWVLLTKRQILPEEKSASAFPIFQWKLAFVPVISVMTIIGLFGFADNTVPGDFLFPVKKATENAQVGLSTISEKSGVHLRLANRRLEELSAIAEDNKVRSLAPTIKEFQDNINEAVNGLSSTGSADLKDLVAEAQKLEENKQKVESVLGVQIGGETDKLEKQLAGYLIADLEKRTLQEEDQKLLTEAKEYFEQGAYTLALEKLWFLSNQ
ncbi:hypothetical protein HYT01_03855 [Candidatus Giovannonibacteria bacterium]|nr:hypothetical protein [Candidatus Giovannonibacteria bacterium]